MFRRDLCLAIGLLIGVISAANAADDVVITSISPDGRYALRTHEAKSEVILLPKGVDDVEWGTVMEIERDRDYPVKHLYWSPDSERFAFSYPETQRFTVTEVFARAGDSFQKVELPEIPLEYPDPGADWSFREKGDSVTPLRWPDSQTLLVKTWVYGYLNNRKTGEAQGGDANGLVRLRFGKGKITVEPMPPLSSSFRGLDKDERLRDIMEHRDT
jgi:hypothetical protein